MANNVDGEIIYSDVNINLGTTSNYELVYNEQAVMNSLLNILRTHKGTRPFRRGFGGSLEEMLWDPLDDITAKRIRLHLQQNVLALEPRISVQLLEVIPDHDQDAYYNNINGWLVRLNNQPFNLTFNLNRNQS